MEEEKIVGKGAVCKCPHHKTMSWFLILVGLDFLLGAVGILTAGFVSITWPILVIILGCMKMVRCNCCSK
jgi:hypothetical protein